MTDTLHALAELYGVQARYRGADDRLRAASPAALLHVLRALGAPLEDPDDARDALRARRLAMADGLLEPASVQWREADDPVHGKPRARPAPAGPADGPPPPGDAGPSVRLRLPAGAGGAVRGRLELEGGEVREWEAPVEALAGRGGGRVEGRAFRFRELALPPDLPDGVHRLRVQAAGRESRQWVIRAPRRAWAPRPDHGPPGRGWGVFLPLYALRTERSWGTADLTDLKSLAEWVGGLGGRVVGTLPLLAAHLGSEAFDPSPYAPVSRLFWNELYVDAEAAPELASVPEARRVLESPELREAVERLRASDRVDYRAAARWKHRALQPLADAVVGDDPRRHEGLRAWLEERPEALAYARFRAVGARREEGWRAWPQRLREAGAEPPRVPPDAMDPAAFRLHVYAQWLAERQIAAAASGGGAGLHLDLPLGTHPDGFDTWRHPALFAHGVTGGAPPDAFFEGGQDWGFPPLHPEALRADGYAYWRAALRTQLRHTTLLRVDHVMGLHRLFWVPDGLGPTEGVYVRYPAEELWALLCLESVRDRTEIVGEDLGTVPPEVRDAMERHGVRRMYVVPFEMRDLDGEGAGFPEAASGAEPGADAGAPAHAGATDPAGLLAPVPANAVASLGTHDLPPFAAFWRERVSGGGGGEATAGPARAGEGRAGRAPRADNPRAALRRFLEHLAASPARWLLVSLEDLWLETEPQNVPGPDAGGASWRRKARHALEEFTELPEVVETLRAVDRLRKGSPGAGSARAADPGPRRETTAPGKG